MGLYWFWDCADFNEVVILERAFFDYVEIPMIARVHCSSRPRRKVRKSSGHETVVHFARNTEGSLQLCRKS